MPPVKNVSIAGKRGGTTLDDCIQLGDPPDNEPCHEPN
jgi:hypothetical protein